MATGHHLAERFAETLTAHDLDAFSTLLHPDYVNHNRYAEPGKSGSVAIFKAFIDACDDFKPRSTTSSTPGTPSSAPTRISAGTPGRSSAYRQATLRSKCTRSTCGASATACSPNTGTNSTRSRYSSRWARSRRSRWPDRCSLPARQSSEGTK